MHTTPGRRLDDDWSNGSGLAERTRRAALAAALVPFLLAGPALAEGVSASGPAGSSAGGGTAGGGAVSGGGAGTAPGVSATDALGGTDVDVGFSAANALGGTVDGTAAAGTDGSGVAIGDDLITGTGELPIIFDPTAGDGDADGTTGAVGTFPDLPAPGTGGRFVVDGDGRVLFMPSGDDQAGASTTDRLTEGVGGDVTPRMVAPGAD